MERLTEIHDILNKMQFFNQRAGRELWNDKPTSVQDEDIVSRDRDIEEVREFINNIVEQLKVENQGLHVKFPFDIGSDVYIVPSKVNFKLNKLQRHEENNRVYHQKVAKITVTEHGWYVEGNADVEYGTDRILTERFFGETWFLTEQEAQSALEKNAHFIRKKVKLMARTKADRVERIQNGLNIKTDCFGYDSDTQECTAMKELICMNKKCSFYKPKAAEGSSQE